MAEPGQGAAERSRSRALAYAALVLGVSAALVAGGQPWFVTRTGSDGPRVMFSGTDTTGRLSQALASVAAAGTLLTLALRRRGREVIGVLLAVVGAAMVATGGWRIPPTPAAVAARVETVLLGGAVELRPTWWPYGYAAGGLLVAAGAIVLVLRARTWRARAARFDRPAPAAATGGGGSEPPGDDPVLLWRAMDAGIDPTDAGIDPTDAGRTAAVDPDVTRPSEGTTMGPTEHTTRSEQSRRSPE